MLRASTEANAGDKGGNKPDVSPVCMRRGRSPETGKQDISYVTMSYDKSREVDQGLRRVNARVTVCPLRCWGMKGSL